MRVLAATSRLLLIHPPVTRPTEPPAGLARLAGSLRSRGVAVEIWDANLDGLLFLLGEAPNGPDTWTRRAWRDRQAHLAGLRSGTAFTHPDTYRRIIGDLERLLARHPAHQQGWRLSLTDCSHDRLPPTSGSTLRYAAAHPDDNPFYALFAPELEARLEATGATHVGFSVNFLGQALSAAAMAGWLRRLAPAVRIIMGGGLITSWMSRHGFANPLPGTVDHMVSGPGEQELMKLLGGTPTPPASTPPKVYDFAGLPLTRYLSPGLVLPVSLAHGCFWARCAFCPETAELSGYHPLPPQEATNLLADLSARCRPALVHILDNAISPAALTDLTRHPFGVPWYGFTRFSQALADLDFCLELRRSGCRMLQLGLESGDQAVLDALGKGIALSEAAQALGNLRAAGIGTYVYLLFGTPPEDLRAARRTLEFTAAHAESIDFLNLAIFNLPIAAPEANSLDTFPFSEGDLSLYLDFRHPRGWDRKAVRRFLDTEFRRHPAIAPIVQRDPPAFTSSHAPFFLPRRR